MEYISTMEQSKLEIDISVIIPVYNAEKYLSRSLESLLEQSKKEIEFICINDGSTDNSLNILYQYAIKDNRLLIINQTNSGVSAARNRGLDIARGRYIMFLDADDWYNENTCQRAYNLITKNDLDMVMYSMNMEYKTHSEHRKILENKYVFFDALECKELRRKCVGLLGDECKEIQKLDYLSLVYLKIYKRSIIEKYHIRFEDIRTIGSFEDGLFVIDYLEHTKSAIYVDEILYHYNRYNMDSITTKYRQNLIEQWICLFQKIEDRINGLGGNYQQALNNRMAYSTFSLGLNVMSSSEGIAYKFKEIRSLLKNRQIYKTFSYYELKKMPYSFRFYFLAAKWKMNITIFVMLYIMNIVRKKNKGIS